MIGSTRIGRKSREQLLLKRVSAGTFVASRAYESNTNSEDYFEPSPLFSGGSTRNDRTQGSTAGANGRADSKK